MVAFPVSDISSCPLSETILIFQVMLSGRLLKVNLTGKNSPVPGCSESC